jgi:hypothetical protein
MALHSDFHDQKVQTRRLRRDGCDRFIRRHLHSNFLHHVQTRACRMGSGSIADELPAHHAPGVCIRVYEHGFRLDRGPSASPCDLGPTYANEKKDYCDLYVQSWTDVSSHSQKLSMV